MQQLPKLPRLNKIQPTLQDRPHINSWRSDLELLVDTNWHDLLVLQSIAGELKQRLSSKAVRLRETVEERIEELIEEQRFSWPTTTAKGSHNRLAQFDSPEIGMLKVLGYSVGKTGLPEAERRGILSKAFMGSLPLKVSAEYMGEWCTPASGRRLQKIAESIAAFTRNAKRNRSQDKTVAIEHWESDLRFLKVHYYDGSPFSFDWPRT